MPVETKIALRRDTAANWTTTNPTLAAGEIGVETDTLKFKMGNGSTAWASLAYSRAGLADSATSIAGGTAGAVPYQSGTGATGFSAAGTPGQVLTSAGTSAPTWTSQTSLTAGKVYASALSRTLFVGSTTPTGMVTGDIWIQA